MSHSFAEGPGSWIISRFRRVFGRLGIISTERAICDVAQSCDGATPSGEGSVVWPSIVQSLGIQRRTLAAEHSV